MTLDDTGTEPEEFLLHLEKALDQVGAEVGSVATDALRTGSPPAEAAAHLAEALGTTSLVLVLDEVDRLAGSGAAGRALSAFLGALDPAVRAVLVARRDTTAALGDGRPSGGAARLTDADLALDADEVSRVLRRLG